jgi:phage tail sheath protein FI
MTEFLHPGVYLEELPSAVHPIEGVSTSTTGFVGEAADGPPDEAVRVTSLTEFERVFGGLQQGVELGYAVLQFFSNGGREAWVVGAGTEQGVPAALGSFDSIGPLGLLSLPGWTDPKTLAAALAWCDSRKTFLLVDSAGDDPQGARDVAAALRGAGSPNAAVYFPWLLIGDPNDGGKPRLTPPGGTVAGVIARTDIESGVFTAPAGERAQVLGVLGTGVDIDDAAAASLAEHGVNPIRSIPGKGMMIWGARTVSSQEDWKYIPVRRLTLFLEDSLSRGLQWAVFEPNEEPLWIRLCLTVTAFLSGLWRQGALHGEIPAEAYFVKCGRDVMAQADIDEGRVVALVGFAPTRPAEFVLLRVVVQQPSA